MMRFAKEQQSGRGRPREGQRSTERADYKDIPKENELYEKFYNDLGHIDREENEEFWAALRRELPNSFRFAGSKGHAVFVQQRLKDHYIPQITTVDHYDGEKVEPPFSIPWYPDGLAWSMTTPRKVIRRYPPFASFQKFLVSETSVGNISRQEAVSMIPPLLLDLKPGMTVLDLCAAPGSKSAQLTEMLHAGEEGSVRDYLSNPEPDPSKPNMADQGRSTGLLIANDVDYKRCHLLIHQLKRLNSPNLIVTNHDATIFPPLRLPTPGAQSTKIQYLKYDRILADVPCSGDGTPRKNPNVWRDWKPSNSLALHATQIRILIRALQQLKVGGRVVYSTCSMNPIEDEAVVAAAIDRCGGLSKVSLIDCDQGLPELKRRPGLNDWKVIGRTGRIWKTWKEVEEQREQEGEDGLGLLVKSMFPPPADGKDDGGDIEKIPFQKCLRVYAHMQDTGAFFIAVLEKLSEIKVRPEAESKKTASKPPITALAEEILARPEHVVVVKDTPIESEKLQTLDGLVPSHPDLGVNVSATARQNKENTPEQEIIGVGKRERDNEPDTTDATTKRLKTKEDPDEKDPEGEQVHQTNFPPPPPSTTQAHDESQKPAATASNKKQPFVESFNYLPADHAELDAIYSFYDITPQFPRDRFMVRNATGEPSKAIYYTSGLARDILTENEGKGIKFVHSGVKMFVKQDTQKAETCKWRVQMEGLPILGPWIGERRVVRLYKQATLKRLLVEMFPKLGNDSWRELGEIGERVRDIEMGCCILKVETSDAPDGFSESMVLPLWRSLYSLNLMLPKMDRQAMLLRLYGEDIPLKHPPQKSNRPDTLAVKDATVEDATVEDATVEDATVEDATVEDETVEDDRMEVDESAPDMGDR
ncbi:MAG: hypothetical protein M1816_007884 [Peltula sp. TS41687]|nr:MAG: hypothetical protein M1816_007884 [Peltula sp. TS41687]